jgi:hypothetical protein
MLCQSVHFNPFLAAAIFTLSLLGAPWAPAQENAVLVMGDGTGGAEKLDSDSTASMADPSTYVGLGNIVQDGLTIRIHSKDPDGQGFRDATLGAARVECIRKALLYVADTVNMPGTLDIMLGASESDGTGALAVGGTLFPMTAGVSSGSAYLTLAEGIDRFPNYAEMVLVVDWGHSWYLGDGFPSITELDLRSVALHEITHALGFVSLLSATGESRVAPGVYSTFDSYLRRSTDAAPMVEGSAPPVFTGGAADLIGNALVFSGPAATERYGENPPVNAASPFSQGTSLQHWKADETDAAVMNSRRAPGSLQRAYTGFEIGALQDLGYANAESGDHNGACPLAAVTFVQPTADSFTADASGTVVVAIRSSVSLAFDNPQCFVADESVRVDYYANGNLRVSSTNASGQFPVSATLVPGSYTFTAVATLLADATEVRAEKTITVLAAVPPAPVLRVLPDDAAYTFGEYHSNDAAYHPFTVTNVGGKTLTGSASLTGNAEFSFHGASTYSLATGESTTVTVRFSPSTTGDFSSTVSFGGNGGNFAVSLTGRGVSNEDLPPGLRVLPDDGAYAYGDFHKKDAVYHPFTVTNTGGGTLNGSASLSGDPEFTFRGASTFSLGSGESTTVTVRFSPSAKGDFAGAINFGSDGGSFEVALTGRCVKGAGLFSCSGLPGTDPWNPASDLLVLLLSVSALFLARRRTVRQQAQTASGI